MASLNRFVQGRFLFFHRKPYIAKAKASFSPRGLRAAGKASFSFDKLKEDACMSYVDEVIERIE